MSKSIKKLILLLFLIGSLGQPKRALGSEFSRFVIAGSCVVGWFIFSDRIMNWQNNKRVGAGLENVPKELQNLHLPKNFPYIPKYCQNISKNCQTGSLGLKFRIGCCTLFL